MARRQDDDERILGHGIGAHRGPVRRIGAVGLEHEREVELARPHARHALARVGLRERELHVRVRALERRNRARHEVAPRGAEGGHRQAAAAQPGQRVELLAGGLHVPDGRLGVPQERGAGGRQAHAAAVPLEQRHAGLLLEQGHLLRDRRGRVAQREGGRGERAVLGHVAQHLQPAQVEQRPVHAAPRRPASIGRRLEAVLMPPACQHGRRSALAIRP